MDGKVLIVDDSLTVRMNLAETLNGAGFDTVACGSAAEARKALADGRFALMILDILLPDANGVDLLKEIRATPEGANLPVMLLSTESEVRDRVRGLTTGANEFIGKPYDSAYVVAQARKLVRRTRAPASPDQPTILVIDDSPTFREELRQALEGASYQVVIAATGEDGLKTAADRRPAAIVVDGMLPGIDGATVIRRIRLDAALRRTPCLLLTASDDDGAELRALDAGADAFVRKGDDTAIVLARLAAMLRGAGAQMTDQGTASLQAPKRVLTVDDSETYLQTLAEALRGDGYEVVLARSGEEALELLAVQPVDCILLDLMMPGIGGQETCRRVKAAPATREIPIVMLTALEDREAMIEGLGAGADDFIAKSSDFEVLRARLLAQIRRKQFEDENRMIREQLLRKELEALEARATRELAETRAVLIEELERKNKELEAFSYSVSHDLRAPLRSIDGFSQALLDDHGETLDAQGQNYLRRVRAAAQRMGELIDDLLQLSQVGRAPLRRERVDLSALALTVADGLRRASARPETQVRVAEGLIVKGDTGLLRVVLENLMGNAWKFSAGTADPIIEVGAITNDATIIYFVRDNGAGFDMTYADRLFAPFHRLHSDAEFPGTGIGLATVQRIVGRHGGRVWAEGEVGKGASIFWTLPEHGSGGAI
jgi:two-component system NtrC family sensor kinase